MGCVSVARQEQCFTQSFFIQPFDCFSEPILRDQSSERTKKIKTTIQSHLSHRQLQALYLNSARMHSHLSSSHQAKKNLLRDTLIKQWVCAGVRHQARREIEAHPCSIDRGRDRALNHIAELSERLAVRNTCSCALLGPGGDSVCVCVCVCVL